MKLRDGVQAAAAAHLKRRANDKSQELLFGENNGVLITLLNYLKLSHPVGAKGSEGQLPMTATLVTFDLSC